MPLFASLHIWAGASNGSFSDASNWIGGSPAGDSAADLVFPPGVAMELTNDVSGLTLHSMSFTGSGYTISGNPIALDEAAIDNPGGGTDVIVCDVVLSGVSTIRSYSGDLGTALAFTGAISGSGGLTLVSGGFTLFGGTAANTYRGTTTILDGGLRLAKPAGVNAIAGTLAIGNPNIGSHAAGVVIDSPEQIANGAAVLVGRSGHLDVLRDETVGPLTLREGGTINATGGRLILGGDLTCDGACTVSGALFIPSSRTIRIPNEYAGLKALTMHAAPSATLTFVGGPVEIGGDWSGPTILNNSSTRISDKLTRVTLNGGSITGTAGSLDSRGGTVGSFTAVSDIHLDSRSIVRFKPGTPGLAAGAAIDLAGALAIEDVDPSRGKSYAVAFGTPVRGSFIGLAEGARIGAERYVLSYTLGDGDDVVLTDVSRGEFRVSIQEVSPFENKLGAPVTLNASIYPVASWHPPAPTGSITFREGSAVLGSAAIAGTTASLTIITLAPGRHMITAVYAGDPNWEPGQSRPAELIVAQAVPIVTSMNPGSAKAGQIVTLSVFGNNFVPGCTVRERVIAIPTEFISSTELRATLNLKGWSTVFPSTEISVANPGPGTSISNAITFPISAADPPPPSGMTIGTNYAEVKMTGGGKTAWIAVLESFSSIRTPSAIVDNNSDGTVRWNLGTVPGLARIVAVDMSSGTLISDGRGGGERLPFPDDALDLGPNGRISRLLLHVRETDVFWVRPGVGAWFIWGQDGSGGTDADHISNQVLTLTPSQLQPVPGSPAAPDSFEPNDVIVMINEGDLSWFGDTIGSHIHPSTADPSLEAGSQLSVREGQPLTFAIVRSGRADVAAGAHYEFKEGSAKAGLDYQAAAGDVTFASGEFVKTIVVPTFDDKLYEGWRDLSMTITSADGATIRTATAKPQIAEDDPKPVMSATGMTVQEGGSGTHHVTIPITLAGGWREPTVVGWTIGYGESERRGSVVFVAGESQKFADVAYEGNETPELDRGGEIRLGSNGAEESAQKAVLLIVDDDSPGVSISDVAVKEGDSGTSVATFTVKLDVAGAKPTTVSYTTADAGTTAGADYLPASGSITFAPAQTQQTIAVTINGDTAQERNETFVVNLTSVTYGHLLRATAAGTILDDDGASPAIFVDDTETRETAHGGQTYMRFHVRLSAATGLPVTVDYASSPRSATANADYINVIGTLTFEPGQTEQRIDVMVPGDDTPEPNETLQVLLSNAHNATIGRAAATGTIIDDDGDSFPRLSVNDVGLMERNQGTSVATFTVSLSAASTTPVTVSYATIDGTATAPSDYFATGGELRFEPGETSRTVNVIVNGDTLAEAEEEFVVVMSNATGAAIANPSGRCVITNDDGAPSTPRGRPSRH